MRIARPDVQRKARCTQPPAATSSPRAESFTAARAREPVQNHTTPSTYTTPSTCAHTATIARNNVTEASANASSATARNMTFSPFRTNKEHLFPNRSGSQGSNFRSFRLSLRTVNRHSAWGTRFLFDGAGLSTPGDAVQKRIKGIREGQKWMTTASGIRTRRASAPYLAIFRASAMPPAYRQTCPGRSKPESSRAIHAVAPSQDKHSGPAKLAKTTQAKGLGQPTGRVISRSPAISANRCDGSPAATHQLRLCS